MLFDNSLVIKLRSAASMQYKVNIGRLEFAYKLKREIMPSLLARLTSNTLEVCILLAPGKELHCSAPLPHSPHAGLNPGFDHLWRVFLFPNSKSQDLFPNSKSQESLLFSQGHVHSYLNSTNSLQSMKPLFSVRKAKRNTRVCAAASCVL